MDGGDTLKGLESEAAAVPPAVILAGVTAAAVAEVFDWQQRSFVFVIFVSGFVGAAKLVL